MQTTTFRAWRRTRSLSESLTEKRNLSSKNIWKSQTSSLSLPSQKIKRGTDTADLRRPFLYPNLSENNTTAPCRVSGNAPGSPAFETLTTRSAVSLCQKSNVMATFLVNRAWRRTRSLRESLSEKRNLSSKNIWKSQTSFLSLQLTKNSSNLLRRATVFRSAVKPGFFIAHRQALYGGCLPVNSLALRSIALFFVNGESSRHPYQGGCTTKNSAIMQTTTFRAWRRTRSLSESLSEKCNSLNSWLDTKSSFYTRLCDLPITRRLAIRLNLVFLCLFLAVLCVDHLPIIATLAVVYVVYGAFQLNKQTKGGEQ